MRWLEAPSLYAGWLAAVAVAVLMGAICFEVVSRYVFDAPTVWAHEIGYMTTGAAFVLGMAYALRRDEHIRVDVFSARFGVRGRAAVDLVGFAVFVLPVTGWLSWTLLRIAIDVWQRGEHSGQSAWNPLIWPFRAVLCLGFVLLLLQVVAEIWKRIAILTGGRRA